MGWLRAFVYLAALAGIVVAAGAFVYLRHAPRPVSPSPDSAPPLAILGDSDSHSYQDSISFPPGSGERGGPYHAATLQWTEVLARLRGNAIDLGAWGVYGTPRIPAWIIKKFGIVTRKPHREDYYYNFAISGAECEDLFDGWQEARTLLQVMDDDPERWRRGIVLIRIGINSFGKAAHMDALARDPPDPETIGRIDRCVAAYRDTVALIRARHPETRFVLVGIFDNSNWARNFERWQSPVEIAAIERALDRFDDALRAIAAADKGIAFFDDRAFFRTHWGGRDANGKSAYRSVRIGPLDVAATEGDPPDNLSVQDGHAGLACNTLWAQALVRLLRERFGLAIDDISDAEAAQFVQAQLQTLPQSLQEGIGTHRP
ncbi:MAG TPA: SGNH/GDSL hydrolase family protein [Rhodanobacteraceae bacterium]|nr:SGNH/GDSL hydrolase family protein [Rhodanobacteraceae bacterium]